MATELAKNTAAGLADATKRLAEYKATAPLCEEHQPNGGARACCVICAMIKYSSALSRIDYALGTPNDMECSLYDVDCNEARVVAGVQDIVTRLAEAERDAARYRFIKQWVRRLDITGYSLTNNEQFEPRIDEAIAAKTGDFPSAGSATHREGGSHG